MIGNKTFFCLWTKVHWMTWNAEGIAVDHISFRFWISGVVPDRDIRDKSRKLSKIAPNFGRFLPSQFFWAGFLKIIPML